MSRLGAVSEKHCRLGKWCYFCCSGLIYSARWRHMTPACIIQMRLVA